MIRVLKSGFYTTIQDAGRTSNRQFGVPVSGVMDAYSSEFANALLGNDSGCAVLEITMTGPELQFTTPTQIAFSGASMNPMINGQRVSNNKRITILPNDILSFGRLEKGLRCYLAIKNGLQTEVILGSQSMYTGITTVKTIQKGDAITYEPYEESSNRANASVKYSSKTLEAHELTVFKGPEYDKLNKKQEAMLLNTQFEVSKYNNRMAYQLMPQIKNTLNGIITTPVLPGTVQLTPAGHLIVLMRDCQTTGGYPRILQLSEDAINSLSQKRQGDTFTFSLSLNL
ncbi:biotin-dependent carboxyltransferase family protein [Winogradskyella poriferorum]|uniref:5-oxoprolinase subunit C family protein n=1 Tax=Winogradskyella poriferorum TaxID=307627 RepID=UPI003D6563CE